MARAQMRLEFNEFLIPGGYREVVGVRRTWGHKFAWRGEVGSLAFRTPQGAPLNFDEAIAAHVNWKMKLRALINGANDIDTKTLGVDNQCALGKWIYTEGSKYSADPNFKGLKDSHQKFHALAGTIATKAKAGAKNDAGKMLDSPEYNTASTTVVNALRQLKKAEAA